MNLKKFAIRGLVFLAVFVALCMFFSGTVRTITTPKVSVTKPKFGRFDEKISVTAKLEFTDPEEQAMALPDDLTLTVEKVNTRAGYTVQAGEVVAVAKVTGYDEKYAQYQDEYDKAVAALIQLQSKNLHPSKRDLAYADAYYGLQDARHEALARELEMDAQLGREKLKRVEEGYPEGASAELKGMIDRWREATAALAEAQTTMDRLSHYTVEETIWSYLTDQREQQQNEEKAEQNLRRLVELNDQAGAIVAPHDGYIVSMGLTVGETYDGKQAMYSLSEKLPVLRADLSSLSDDKRKKISEGMTANLTFGEVTVESKVVAKKTDSEGKWYADIELTPDAINAAGSVYSLTQDEQGIEVTLVYRAKANTTILPASAVSGTGETRTIFVVEKDEGVFGGSTWTVSEMKVTVAGEADGRISVREELSAYTVVSGRDRTIRDGDTVMLISNKKNAGQDEDE